MKLPRLNKMQDSAIDWALERDRSAWFMPPGMGKTRAWLNVMRDTKGRKLVVAPKLVCSNTWPSEIKKWGFSGDFDYRFLHGKNKNMRTLPELCLINYEGLPWLSEQLRGLDNPVFDSVIYDELSKLKNPESKRFKEWDAVIETFKYSNGGTGTPVGAHLKDLYGEMYMCDMGASLGTDYERFLRTHFYEDDYTHTFDPYSDAEDMILDKICDTAISFDINDLDLPPLSHHPIYLDLPDAVRDYYTEMHETSEVEALDVSAVNAAVRSGKLRQLASGGFIDDNSERKMLHSAKAEHFREIVDEYQGEPILVFFDYVSDYMSICAVMGYEVPVLYGKTKVRDAKRWIREWNAGKLPVFALHPRSAGHGLNLQDSGRVLVFYTLPWSYELVDQGIGRLWRQGQKNKVLVYYLIVEDTVDEKVFGRVQDRKNLHNRVMKGLL